MKIQTEHLDNHVARLTVEVDPDRLEKARQTAIRKVAKMVQIPGFRKGKAPSQLVLRYVGEAQILEEAIDELGQEIYRETLDESKDIKPYGPGALEDIRYDPLVFVYTVPLQPTIELNNYRDVRVEFNQPEVTDEDVERALQSLLEGEAASEETEGPVEAGDRITVDIHSFFVKEEQAEGQVEDETQAEADESAEAEAGEADEHDHSGDIHEHDGDPFIHEHGLQVILHEGNSEPLAPGFTAQMIGAAVGETREFNITYPTREEDADIDDEVAGRTVEFVVSVQKIEKVTLPEWTNELATRLGGRFAPTEDEVAAQEAEQAAADESAAAEAEATADTEAAEDADADADETQPEITPDQLRARVRRSLELQTKRNAEQEYANQVLNAMVESATVGYPDAMLDDQIHRMIESLDQRLRQQGMSLEMYQSITGKTHQDLHVDYEDSARQTIKRSLVLLEVAMKEGLNVTPEDYEAEIDQMMQMFGGGSPELRKTFDNPSFRESIYNRILQDRTYDRLALIGKGEAPELPAESETVQSADLTTDTAAEVSTEVEPEAATDETVNEADNDSNV